MYAIKLTDGLQSGDIHLDLNLNAINAEIFDFGDTIIVRGDKRAVTEILKAIKKENYSSWEQLQPMF